ncbi:MAG TPA: hypothetical protein DEB09_04420 [Candidatus Magasanikbacteria bacterium]|nr:hypothetical protein [Candidatus Magasanikbacteria bacterium]
MRKDQINALIQHAKNDFKNIEVQYLKSLEEQTISTSLQIDVKNMMENLKSALDYLAHDIYEIVIMPARKATGDKEIENIYFPYGKTENDFKSGVGKSLPKLDSLQPTLYNTIENIQPHKSGNDWLYSFCQILNEKKHNTLTPQKREEKRGLNIKFPGGAGISMGPGSSISGGGIIQSGSDRIILNNNYISGDSPARNVTEGVIQTIIRWVSFKFADTDVEVLPLLKKGLLTTEQLSESVYSQLS